MSKNKYFNGVKLIPKKNGKGYSTSYTLNIASNEAKELGFINDNNQSIILKKEIVDGKLIVSRAYPQTPGDFIEILDSFGLVGKRLSKRTFLQLLHYIEGDSQNYYDQLHKIRDSIQIFNNRLVCYKGQYVPYSFLITVDKNRVITRYYNLGFWEINYF